jgi:RNA polymerase sigma factor (sigma-70 family)
MPDAESYRSDWRSWLEQQFVRHRALVRAVIWNRLGRGRDPHPIEELAAETWARAVRGVQAPQFNAAHDFAPWVCAIAVNVCREHFRRQERAAANNLPRPEDMQDPADYQQALELLELHRALAECLGGLNETERKVYELRFEQGLSGRATAEALGVPESTFREKLLSGLFGKLARCLAGKGFDEALAAFSAQRHRAGQQMGERRMP